MVKQIRIYHFNPRVFRQVSPEKFKLRVDMTGNQHL